VDNSLGRIAQISTFKDTRLDESRNTASPILAVFGEVDLTFVVKIVLSLFVIMLTYDAVSGEKERGTLKLMLANNLPRYKILLSKIIGGITVLAVTFLIPILIGIAYLMLAQPDVIKDFDDEAWIRLIFIALVYFLYLTAFVAIGLAVSSASHNSATSFIVLLMIWVLFVAIIPGLSMTAAERLRPAKSYATLQANAYKKIANDQRGLITDMMTKWASVLSSDESKISEVYTEFLNDLSNIHQDVLDRFNRSFEKAQHSQIVLAESLSRIFSPTSAMSFAAQNLAGSGWARQQEYLDQLREFRTSFGQYIKSEIAKEEFKTMDDMFRKRELIVDRAQINFKFQEEPINVVLARTIPDMAILAGVALLCFLFSAIFFARYDVR
jgi:ABC-type transport system involved in multi-copper enzyme maturation permease subunit